MQPFFERYATGQAGRGKRRQMPVLTGLLVLACVAGSAGVGGQIARLARNAEPMGLMVVDPQVSAHQPVRRTAQVIELPMVEPAARDPVVLSMSMSDLSASIAPASVFAEREAFEQATALQFDHRPLRHVRTIRMRVTAYSPDERSCGIWADGFTASGYSVWTNGMRLVAADTSLLPFGSVVTVPGYHDGQPVPVLDRGGAIKGHRLDVLMPTHEQAMQWGVQWLDVDVWTYADP